MLHSPNKHNVCSNHHSSCSQFFTFFNLDLHSSAFELLCPRLLEQCQNSCRFIVKMYWKSNCLFITAVAYLQLWCIASRTPLKDRLYWTNWHLPQVTCGTSFSIIIYLSWSCFLSWGIVLREVLFGEQLICFVTQILFLKESYWLFGSLAGHSVLLRACWL